MECIEIEPEERFDDYIYLKEKGDEELKHEKYSSAINYYLQALDQIELYESYYSFDLNIKITTLKILSNLCKCYFNQNNFGSLLEYSSKGIKLYHSYSNKLNNINSIPELFAFRAIAKANLNDFKMAEEDLKTLETFSKEKDDIKNLIIKVKSIISDKKNENIKLNSENKFEKEKEKSESTSNEDDSIEEGKKNNFSKIKFLKDTPFGKLYTVIIEKDNIQEKRILKKIKIKSQEEIEEICKEIEIVKNINTKYAIKIKDYYLQQKGNIKIMNILFDSLENQDLKSFKKEELSFDTFREILIKICFALKYFQLNNIILEFFHPENIFIDKEKNVIFSGFNKTVNFINKANNDISLYKSPEKQNEEKESIKSNMWTLGCVLFELKYNQKAFYNIKDIINININKKYNDNYLEDLFSKLLCEEENRITINKLLYDIIFKSIEQNYDILFKTQDLSVYNNFIDDYLMKKYFSYFSFSCEKCGEIPDIILRENGYVLISCNKCGITENEILENISFYSSKWLKLNKIKEIKIHQNINNIIQINNFRDERIYIEEENDNNSERNEINENYFIEMLKKIKIKREEKYNKFNEIINCIKETKMGRKYKEFTLICNKIKENMNAMYFNNMKMDNSLLIFSFILFKTYKNIKNIKYDTLVQYKEIFDLINKEYIEKKCNEFISSIKFEVDKYIIYMNNITNEENQFMNKYIGNIFNRNSTNIDKNDFDKNKQFIIDNINFSKIIKKLNIIQELKNENYFLNVDEKLNNYELFMNQINSFNDNFFILSLLSKCLEHKGIKVYISQIMDKNHKKFDDIELASIQSLFCLINQQKYILHFDYGETENKEILNNPLKQETFINEMKLKISESLKINIDKLILADIHEGSVAFILYLLNPTNDEVEAMKKAKYLKNCIKIELKPLLDELYLSPSILDSRGNRFKGWGKNEKRGGEDYIPPLNGWLGIGLNVMSKYDNRCNNWIAYKENIDGEFAIAYLGINNISDNEDQIIKDLNDYSVNITKMISSKLYQNELDLKKNKTSTCGEGVCLFQNPEYAENCAGIINLYGYNIKIILMCRVNPKKIRQPENFKDCWILNPTPEEIRPYRILIKVVPNSQQSECNELTYTLKPVQYIISSIETSNLSILELKENPLFKRYSKINSQTVNDDVFVIRVYSSSYYRHINEYLRVKKLRDEKILNEEQIKSWIFCLQRALLRNKNVKEDQEVYRGIDKPFPKNLGIGSTFYFREFISTSTKIEFALNWIHKNKKLDRGTLLIIKIKNNGNNNNLNYCYYIEDITTCHKEYEILISSHCLFTVTNIEHKEKNIDYVYLTCLGFPKNELFQIYKKHIYLNNILNSICKINFKNDNYYGFLAVLNKNQKPLYCAIFLGNLIDKNMRKKNIKISLLNNTHNIDIDLNDINRFITQFKYLETYAVIIEILPSDYINNSLFLLPNLNYVNDFKTLEKTKIYIPYLNNDNINRYSNKIIFIENNKFLYSGYSGDRNIDVSGFPIFCEGTSLIIGINKKEKDINFGYFIYPIIEYLNGKNIIDNSFYKYLFNNNKNLFESKNVDIDVNKIYNLKDLLIIQYLVFPIIEKTFDSNFVLDLLYPEEIKYDIDKICLEMKKAKFFSLGTRISANSDSDILDLNDEENMQKLFEKIQKYEKTFSKINMLEISKNIRMKNIDLNSYLKIFGGKGIKYLKFFDDIDISNETFGHDIESTLSNSIFEYKIIHIIFIVKDYSNFKENNKNIKYEKKLIFNPTKFCNLIQILSRQSKDSNNSYCFEKSINYRHSLDDCFSISLNKDKNDTIPKVGESFHVLVNDLFYDNNFRKIFPKYAITLKRMEYLIIWRDYNFNLNNPNEYKSKEFNDIKEFHKKLKI